MTTPLVMLGRIMLAALFIAGGIGKIMGFAGTTGYIASKGLPQPQALAAATIALEIGGGILLALGRFTLPVALAFAVFCLATAGIFHNFWAMDAAQYQAQMNNFLKNVALAGAFLILAGQSMQRT